MNWEEMSQHAADAQDKAGYKGTATDLDGILVVVLQLVELLQREPLGPPALVQVHQHALLSFRLLVINRDA